MKQNRHISKIAVIGSGIMGSRIACHFANIGVDVLLLDIVPFDLTKEQLKDKTIRNSIVNDALKSTLKSKPSPIYSKEFVSKIKAIKAYKNELREFPHPRSIEALEVITKRWGSVAGFNYAEAFRLVRTLIK